MKPKRELKVGDKIRFSGPISSASGLCTNQLAEIKNIDGENILVYVLGDKLITPSWINRRQVTHVFVKKKKESKYPKEIWANIFIGKNAIAIESFVDKINAESASNRNIDGKAIRYVLAKGQ